MLITGIYVNYGQELKSLSNEWCFNVLKINYNSYLQSDGYYWWPYGSSKYSNVCGAARTTR